jgi:MFS family permease
MSAAYQRDRYTLTAFGLLAVLGLFESAVGAALPYLRAEEDLGYFAASAHQAGFALGGLGGLAGPRLERRYGRGAMVLGGLVGASIGGLGVGYGSHPAVTVPATLVISLSLTTAFVAMWAELADRHRARSAVALTEGEVAISLGAAAFPVLVGALAGSALGWSGGFLVAAAAAAAVLPAAARARPRGSAPRPEGGPGAPVSWPTLALVYCATGAEACLSFWSATYLDDAIGMQAHTAVALAGVLFASMLVGRLVGSRLSRSISPPRLLAGVQAVTLAGMATLLAAPGPSSAVTGIAIAGLGLGVQFPLSSALHIAHTPGGSTVALAQTLAVTAVGFLTAPVLVGALAQASSLRAGLGLVVVLPALALLTAVRTPECAAAVTPERPVPAA